MKEFFALAFLLLLVSCGGKTAVPKDVIPVAKMTDVMWDVMVADGLATHRYPADSFKRFDTSVVLYQEIAKAHGTTQAQLKKSLQFYEGRPDLLQVIIDSLQKRALPPIQASKKAAAIKKDSLKKAPRLIQKPTP